MNDDWIKDLSRVYGHQRRVQYHRQNSEMKSKCEQIFKLDNYDYTECASITKKSFANLVNSSKFNYADPRPKGSYCSVTPSQMHARDKCLVSQSMPTGKSNYLHYESHGSLRSSKILTSMLNQDNDLKSPEKIKQIWDHIRCKINQASETIRSNMFYDSLIEKVH